MAPSAFRISFGTLAAMLGLAACSEAGAATTSLESLVRNAYAGWTIQRSRDDYCPAAASVSGNFNGDSIRDYAVRLTRGDRGLIVAFLSNGRGFDRVTLEQGSREDVERQFLEVLPRGSRHNIIIDDAGDPRPLMILTHDAPAGGTCEASSWIYIIEGTRFTRAFTSD